MTKQHSPAPWTLDRYFGGRYIDDANGRTIVHDVGGADHREANAALIAAAPELLEACKLAIQRDLEQVDHVGFGAIGESGRKIILAAISKAEGNVPAQNTE